MWCKSTMGIIYIDWSWYQNDKTKQLDFVLGLVLSLLTAAIPMHYHGLQRSYTFYVMATSWNSKLWSFVRQTLFPTMYNKELTVDSAVSSHSVSLEKNEGREGRSRGVPCHPRLWSCYDCPGYGVTTVYQFCSCIVPLPYSLVVEATFACGRDHKRPCQHILHSHGPSLESWFRVMMCSQCWNECM